jgi:hypothetical protein
VGPRVGLDAVVKRHKSHHCPCGESNSGRPACSLVSVLSEDDVKMGIRETEREVGRVDQIASRQDPAELFLLT